MKELFELSPKEWIEFKQEYPNIRPVEEGDNLSGATLYFTFPDDMFNNIINVNVINFNNNMMHIRSADIYWNSGYNEVNAHIIGLVTDILGGVDETKLFYKRDSVLQKNISKFVMPTGNFVVDTLYPVTSLIREHILVDTTTLGS